MQEIQNQPLYSNITPIQDIHSQNNQYATQTYLQYLMNAKPTFMPHMQPQGPQNTISASMWHMQPQFAKNLQNQPLCRVYNLILRIILYAT